MSTNTENDLICGSIDKEVTPETNETSEIIETHEIPESSTIENVESELEDIEYFPRLLKNKRQRSSTFTLLLILKSYWFDKPWFINEGKLLLATSTPSLGTQHNSFNYTISHRPWPLALVGEQREGYGGLEVGLEYLLIGAFDLLIGCGEEEDPSRSDSHLRCSVLSCSKSAQESRRPI